METYLKEMGEKEEDELKDALATFEEIEGARLHADSECIAVRVAYHRTSDQLIITFFYLLIICFYITPMHVLRVTSVSHILAHGP